MLMERVNKISILFVKINIKNTVTFQTFKPSKTNTNRIQKKKKEVSINTRDFSFLLPYRDSTNDSNKNFKTVSIGG